MSDKFLATEQHIRKKVLWPIGITLVIFLALFLTVFQIYLQRELTRKLDKHIELVATLYHDFLVDRSATMQSLIKLVQKRPALKQAMIRQDRDSLLKEATPLFQEFRRAQNITHFYFHDPDGVTLLRVHKPDRFGDQIKRITLTQARGSHKISSGAELGPLGTFTLRVVVPWFSDNHLIGYIEFGEEVEPLLKQVAEQTGSQMALLIDKKLLDQKLWQEGQTMLGRTTKWAALSDHVVTDTTDEQLLKDIPRFVLAPYHSGQKVIDVSLHKQQYRGRYLPLIDASGREIGRMMVLQNSNGILQDHHSSIALVSVLCIVLGGALFLSAYTILGRTDQRLIAARQKLLDEIEKTRLANIQLEQQIAEKQRAERALKEANDHLEQRVIQRTSELNQQKKLLKTNLIKARQTRDQIYGIMRSVNDLLFVIDASGKFILMNEQACSLLRLNLGEVIGLEVSSVIWLDALRDRVLETLEKKTGGVQFDFELSNAELGSSLMMQARSSVLSDPQGQYEGMIFLARDVTRDRSMDRLKSEFISIAAHELRTPLTTIFGFAEFLRDHLRLPESERLDYAQIICDKTELLARLLDEMLDITRIESGRKLELHLRPTQLKDLVLPVLKQYQMRDKNRQFEVDLAAPEILVQADPDKIAQVMENLLSNAIKFSENGSPITLSGKITDDGYLLTIGDQGIGMSPEQASHAFEKFYRGDSADRAIKGTGLGLTIARHIVEEHHGQIWIGKQLEKGTKIHILLPLESGQSTALRDCKLPGLRPDHSYLSGK